MQAILQADLTRPNELEPELKLAWLAALNGQIRRTLFLTHEDGPECAAGSQPPAAGRDPAGAPPAGCGTGGPPPAGCDPEAELPVPWPWDELCVLFLVMRIDLENGELERYNNDAACFNRAWRDFAGDYVRTHRPLGTDALRF